jgi:hypothetical protein
VTPAILCLIVPLVIAGMIAIGIAAHRAEVRRREAFAAAAAQLGLQYDLNPDASWSARYGHFECFQRGHSRTLRHRMFGRLRGNGPVCSLGEFEFKETHGSGKNRRTVTYRFGFVIMASGYGQTPDMLIRREHFLDRVAGFLGFDDIDFESVEFSKRFMVKSSDKRFAYDLIDPAMMEFLLHEGTPNIDLGHGGFCLWYGHNARLEPAQLASLADWGLAFLERWPRVLVSGLTGGSRSAPPPPPPPPPS